LAIRVFIVDDYQDCRREIRILLNSRPELQVIGEASDGSEAVQKAEELKPDLILLDIGLPKLNGIEAARLIRQLSPNSKIVFLSQENSPDIVEEALSTGAQGYVHKARAQSDLLPAIDAVLRGKEFDSSVLKNHKFTDPTAEKTSHSHELLFFSDDRVLLDSFSGFIAAALKAGNAAIVLVTKSHHEMLHQRLKADGVDVDGAIRQGTYISLDLADTLAKLMVAGLPDPVRFVEDFSGLIDASSKATKAEHPRVAFLR
jgi:DNA-binding NarL/FixJ family response regulator